MKSEKKRAILVLLAVLLIVGALPVSPALAADGDTFKGTDGHTYQIISTTEETAALVGLAEGTTELVKTVPSWKWVVSGETYSVSDVRLGAGSANVAGLKKLDIELGRGASNGIKLDISGCTGLEELSLLDNALTELDLSNFPLLRELSCVYNALTELDLSSSKELTTLYCDTNYLSELDVSSCKALTTLSCADNKLSAIDISKNPVLTQLTCSENPLYELDLSGHTKLISVTCESGQLTKLNISGCTSLEKLNVYNNSLTNIDVSSFINLKDLSISNNKLTALDVSKNTALVSLYCGANNLGKIDVSKNIALKQLYCFDTNLTELDVSKNVNLERLSCMINNLTTLDLSNNVKLIILYCRNNNLTSLDLSKNAKLVSVLCQTNALLDIHIPVVVNLLTGVGNYVTVPMVAKGDGFESVQQYELNKGSYIVFNPTEGVKYDPATKKFTTDRAPATVTFSTRNANYEKGEGDISGVISFMLEGEKPWVNPFTDIKENESYYPNVAFVADNGIFNGTSTTTFGPNDTMTRGMVVTVLGRIAGVDVTKYSGASFSDVDTSIYYAPYVKWASSLGIVNGIGDNKYAPEAEISRQDLAVILCNYIDKMGITVKQGSNRTYYLDHRAIADYAADKVETLCYAHILTEDIGESFLPTTSAKRLEFASMLARYYTAIR